MAKVLQELKVFRVFVGGAKLGDRLKVKIVSVGSMNAGAQIVYT